MNLNSFKLKNATFWHSLAINYLEENIFMEFIRIPEQVDVTRYKGNQDQLEAKYGLPLEVKFCKICVISNQRPNSAQTAVLIKFLTLAGMN